MAYATIKHNIHDYWSAQSVLRGRESRKVGNNTVLFKAYDDGSPDGFYCVRYHATVIAEFRMGWSSFYSGGYHTYTTKDRINQMLPAGWVLYQHKFEWFLRHCSTGEVTHWHEGCKFTN